MPWGAWCYRVDERRAVLGGAFNDGGSLFGWLRGALRLPSLAAAEAELAGLEPDGHGLTVLPFWGGERSTGWADDARGAIVGLRLHTPTDRDPARLSRGGRAALRRARPDLARSHAAAVARWWARAARLLHSPAWTADPGRRPRAAGAGLVRSRSLQPRRCACSRWRRSACWASRSTSSGRPSDAGSSQSRRTPNATGQPPSASASSIRDWSNDDDSSARLVTGELECAFDSASRGGAC